MAPLSIRSQVWVVVITVFVIVLSYFDFAPGIISHGKGAQLRKIYAQQAKILTPTIEDLTSAAPNETAFQCFDVVHTYTQTKTLCQNFQVYKYQIAASQQSLQTVISKAQKLDQVLKANGWSLDRPHDAINSVAASVPRRPIQPLHTGAVVPYHKNIGSISCNLEVIFSGTNAGTVPGSINVNRFSCQQGITYFMLHLHVWHFVGV